MSGCVAWKLHTECGCLCVDQSELPIFCWPGSFYYQIQRENHLEIIGLESSVVFYLQPSPCRFSLRFLLQVVSELMRRLFSLHMLTYGALTRSPNDVFGLKGEDRLIP